MNIRVVQQVHRGWPVRGLWLWVSHRDCSCNAKYYRDGEVVAGKERVVAQVASFWPGLEA
jgi:hypothetical protein